MITAIENISSRFCVTQVGGDNIKATGFFNWFSSFGGLHTSKEQSRLNRNYTLPIGGKQCVKYFSVNPCNGEPSITAFDNLFYIN